jgi:hypothetical protein
VNLAPIDQFIVDVNTFVGNAVNQFLDASYALWANFF